MAQIYLNSTNDCYLLQCSGGLFWLSHEEVDQAPEGDEPAWHPFVAAEWGSDLPDQAYFDSLIRCQAPPDRMPAWMAADLEGMQATEALRRSDG